ncbi:ABC transporter ATP-binding protein [Klebsiella pneumoniae]|nr:ABC transporter ATP-binding protein [Klebsiella pneumoniae]HBY1729279.1 ABC transporter ATP-binding protein [Klebsiella pneumoniae]
MIELSVENLHLTYGDNPVLKGVSMTLGRGEVVSLLGPSGSGKTTLLRAVAGLEKPTSGRIAIGNRTVYDGTPRSEIPAEERNLGLVFQSYALWPHKTVFDNVAYPLKLRKVAAGEIKERVQRVLDQLGLGHLGNRHPHQLSGGQQQRVAIGELVYNPPVILLDEPLSNLDAKLREEARVFLRELIIKLGLSALMVTHDQNEAMAISDRILLLNNGVIEQQGTPQEMYGSPATLFAAEFMGSNNRLHGKVMALENGRARIEGASWSLWGRAGEGVSVGEPATAVIRVERLRLDGAAQDNSLQLPLLTSMYLGDRWEYLFRTEGDDFPLRAYGTALRDAEHCHLTLPAEDVWIFPQR